MSSRQLPIRAPIGAPRTTRDYLARRRAASSSSKIGEDVEVEVEDERQEASQSPSARVPLTLESINDRTKQIRRIIHIRVSGTMAQFGAETPQPKLFRSPEAVMYTARAPPGTPEDRGNPRYGLLLKAKVVSSSNTFPCRVIWSSVRLPGADFSEKSDGTVQKGFFVTPSATHDYQPTKNEGRIRCRPPVDKEFLRKYSHAKPGIEDVGVMPAAGGRFFIPRFNPLEEIISNNRQFIAKGDIITRQDVDPVTKQMVNHGIEVSEEVLEKARNAYRQQVLPNVPIIDMLDINLAVEREGAEWSDPLDDMPTEMFGTSFSTTIAIEVTYRLMFEEEIGR